MTLWEADLYRRPLRADNGEPLWELLLCDRPFAFTYGATVPQSQVSAGWVQAQLQIAIQKSDTVPDQIAVFRPGSLALLQTAAQALDIPVAPSRYTFTLKQWLVQRSRWYPSQPQFSGESYDPLAVERPAPEAVPENLWGEQWRFAAIGAGDFQKSLLQEPIPVCSAPAAWLPLQAGIASNQPLPGVIIDGGRRAMALVQWLQAQRPVSLNYIPGEPDGLILEAGLVERWILATFEDAQVKEAAQTFQARQQQSLGLHFLLVQPDDSGMTYTGLWLLRPA